MPSAQLTYQSVPAIVLTTPMSMLSWKTALTMTLSRVSSRSMNRELELAPEPLRLSSGTAPTAQKHRRLVLLPLTKAEHERSSTPISPWSAPEASKQHLARVSQTQIWPASEPQYSRGSTP